MADPWAWQKYSKRRGVSNGMSLGTGGGNIGIADYLSENFDNLGGGAVSPQEQLAAQQDAIRGGAAMKSPETDVTRFITQAPDGSNYMDPKPAEIPPMLARQITDPTPPAPASGSGINPQMLVRPQGDAQSRGSNLANTMPRREDFRRREAMAAKMEASALEAQNSGFANFLAPETTSNAAMARMARAQQLRQMDDADYQASLNQYFIQNPDQHEEWKRRTMIDKKIIPRSAPVNAIDPRTKNLVGIDEYGGKKVYEGVMPQNAYEIGAVGERMAEDDKRRTAEEDKNRALKNTMSKREYDASMARTGAQNKATDARGPNGQKAEAIEYPDDEDEKIAKRSGPPGSPAYTSAMLRRGFIIGNNGTDEAPIPYFYRPKKRVLGGAATGTAAQPGAGAAAPAIEWKRDANGKPIPAGR